jgi:uncharacterized phage protein (TIGR01671 family)
MDIKFRSFDYDNEIMYHSDKVEKNGDFIIFWMLNERGIYFEERNHASRSFVKPNQVSMQYIGLEDKNRTKIYQGDILQFDCGETLELEVVVFDETQGCFTSVPDKKYIGHESTLFDTVQESFEVIGNIFKDIELMPNWEKGMIELKELK